LYNKNKDKKDDDGLETSLTHTGRLGEVMKESLDVVKIAVFNFIQDQNIPSNWRQEAYHLHVPMGATPKDGPSAGTSLFAALTSVVTGQSLQPNLAMTGEITTLGEVISIGGVREKLTACKNHKITRVVLPLSNKKHVKKLPEEFLKGFTIFYVSNIEQLYEICFKLPHDSQDFSSIESLGVTVEQHEVDSFMEEVINNEDVWKENLIEQL